MVDGKCPSVLVLGAHPDDAEIFAGGLIIRHCRAGARVRIVSVTDGSSGHYRIPPEQLKQIRRQEAAAAGARIGAEYVTWDFRDGYLEPNLDVRAAIIREIRSFQPDLVLTHRPNDYHPDHRAVGCAVQDASYMVTVPHVCSETPALKRDPIVAYMCDLFSRPTPMRPDVVLDVAAEFPQLIEMAACHASQVFDWLPYHDGLLAEVPESAEARLTWLGNWLQQLHQARFEHFAEACQGFEWTEDSHPKIEVYEISEYAAKLSAQERSRLFPSAPTNL